MEIDVRIDHTIKGTEGLSDRVKEIVAHSMARFVERISFIEVRLSDANSGKGGADDKQCTMEAKLVGRALTTVVCEASTIEQAIKGAVGKLKRSVESTLSREATLGGRRDHH